MKIVSKYPENTKEWEEKRREEGMRGEMTKPYGKWSQKPFSRYRKDVKSRERQTSNVEIGRQNKGEEEGKANKELTEIIRENEKLKENVAKLSERIEELERKIEKKGVNQKEKEKDSTKRPSHESNWGERQRSEASGSEWCTPRQTWENKEKREKEKGKERPNIERNTTMTTRFAPLESAEEDSKEESISVILPRIHQ